MRLTHTGGCWSADYRRRRHLTTRISNTDVVVSAPKYLEDPVHMHWPLDYHPQEDRNTLYTSSPDQVSRGRQNG